MIGLRFVIPNQYGTFLNKILNGIDLSFYEWHIISEEIEFLDKFSLDKEKYDFSEMQKILEKDMYLIFGNFQLTKPNTKIGDIYSYDDFLLSDCDILITIIDSSYIDIYAKSKKTLRKIHENILSEKYDHIEFIYNNCDPRNFFSFR